MRNQMIDVCDECGKKVAYEKDEDGGTIVVEEIGHVKNLCPECHDEHLERERQLREDEDE